MKERESSFESLRLIAQYMIVVYHILLFWFVNEGPNPMPIYKALLVPLHTGVILFVLISGYFGIKCSIKGVFRIVSQLLIYGLGFYILNHFIYGDPIKIKQLFFVSNTPYWFIRTYLFLYLLAPTINKMVSNISLATRVILLFILAWISCWTGLMEFDCSMFQGKNVVHFIFLYLIGNTLYEYREAVNKLPTYLILSLYLFGCIWGCLMVYAFPDNIWIFKFFFQYNSIILVANAVLLFVLFMRMHFHNKAINYLASSCLAIYLIHGSDVIFRHWIKDAAIWIQEFTNLLGMQFLAVLIMSLLIVIGCIGLDKCLTPVWNLVLKVSQKINTTRFGKMINQYI